MSVLWVLPVLVLAAGIVAVVVATRQTALAAGDLRQACSGLSAVRDAASGLVDDVATTRRTVERVRTRSVPPDESR